MTSDPGASASVLGIVVTRNEWPLVGAAIAHALTHHADMVCVIDHASTDGTAEGLSRLLDAWGARLRIRRIDDDAFFQEAFNLAALEATRDLPHEWIYVFDADEFLLARDGGGLPAYLTGVPADVDAVRYLFDHYIAPRDHDPRRVEQLVRFRYRARNLDSTIPPIEPAMAAIERGELTLFDIPFRSKLIARRRTGSWPAAGAHVWRSREPMREHPAAIGDLRCAHLTYPSLERLHRKAELGANKVRNGFPVLHGWQNQMIARIAAAGNLERFWERHSIGPGTWPTLGPRTELTEDDEFPRAVATSLANLDAALGKTAGLNLASVPSDRVDPLPIRPVLSALRVALDETAVLAQKHQRLCGDLAAARRALADARHASNAIAAERDRLAGELARLSSGPPRAASAAEKPATGAAAPQRSPDETLQDERDHRRVAWMRRWLRPGIGLDRVFMNTRMLRDDLGAPCLAHLCDWSITDVGFHGNVRRQPRTVFVRARFAYLKTFFTEYLPRIEAGTRFVFVTGSDDHTVPRQTDLRYGSFENNEYQAWFEALRRDPRLIRWYADNVDTELEGLIPIPCGTAGKYGCAPSIFIPRDKQPIRLRSRPLRALCTHRVRKGPQWEKRRLVTALAAEHWRELVDVEESIPGESFHATLARYPFTICVTGGGLDAAPKAWVAMLAGSIPIIERNAMAPAYADFPVAYVDDWTANSITREKLEGWIDTLAPFYERPDQRRRVLHQLSLGHWWRKIRNDARQGTATRRR